MTKTRPTFFIRFALADILRAPAYFFFFAAVGFCLPSSVAASAAIVHLLGRGPPSRRGARAGHRR